MKKILLSIAVVTLAGFTFVANAENSKKCDCEGCPNCQNMMEMDSTARKSLQNCLNDETKSTKDCMKATKKMMKSQKKEMKKEMKKNWSDKNSAKIQNN